MAENWGWEGRRERRRLEAGVRLKSETQAFVNARSKNPDRVLVGWLDLPEGRIWNRVGGLMGRGTASKGRLQLRPLLGRPGHPF